MQNPVRRVSFWLLLAILAFEVAFTSPPRAYGFGEVGSLGVHDNAGFAPAAVVDSASEAKAAGSWPFGGDP